MNLDALVGSLKSHVLSQLEEAVYQQAESQNLADTVLRALVESAVERLQVEMPAAAGLGAALFGALESLAPVARSLGLDQQVVGMIRAAGVDTAMRERIVRGVTRYLEAHGAHLMEVAVQAAVGKLTRPR